MMWLNKNLSDICAFGTDGQAAMIEVIRQQCPFASHIMFFTLCRKNAKWKMHELHVPSGVAAEYFFGIFRGYEDTTFVAGLADVRTSVDFDDKHDALEEVWNKT